MDLESVQIALRPRKHWESIDLGALMVRRWWWQLTVAWLVFALPMVLLTALLTGSTLWTVVVIWWFKPVYERLPLWLLSTAIFGEAPSVRATLRSTRDAVLPGMLAALTTGRLSPSRSFLAPVTVLERMPQASQVARYRVLQRSAGGAAMWLTVLGFHLEAFVYIGMVSLTVLLVPTELDVDWSVLVNGASLPDAIGWMSIGLGFLAMMLVAPFYIACGFSLYLNRRVELEAWDLELGFRRLAHRAAAAALLLAAFVVPQGLDAAENGDDAARSKAEVLRVLEGPEFHTEITRTIPAFLEDWETDSDDPSRSFEGLVGLFRAIAAIAEIVLWAAAALVVLWIGYRMRWWQPGGKRVEDAIERPRVLMGLSLQPESLPADVADQADQLWKAGRARDALGLLYRAALVMLIAKHECRFRESDTEGEVLVTVRSTVADGDVTAAFVALTRAWQRHAYAHLVPSTLEFDSVLAGWRSVFGSRSGE